jgi:peptide/nickel transport system permease protein
MRSYLIRRVFQALPLLVVISIIVFLILQMTPGGPLSAGENLANTGRATEEALERMRERYGLNDPLYVQYFNWLTSLTRGDWGISFNSGQPVLSVISERLPATLLLTGAAFLVTLLLAIPIGILAAVRQYSVFDYLTTSVAFLGISIPSFWFGLMLLFVFSFSFDLLPSSGLSDPRRSLEGWAAVVDLLRHLVMPVAVLALISTAGVTRYMRASMLEVINQDYVRTARSKGLSEAIVVGKHAVRNGAIPIVTVLALEVPELFLGSVITETIFGIPGMGRLFIESAHVHDYPVLMGILLIAAFLIVLFNLLADIFYGLLDPRIAYD